MDVEVSFANCAENVENGINKCTENLQLICTKENSGNSSNEVNSRNEGVPEDYLFGESEETYNKSFWDDVDGLLRTQKNSKDTLIDLINSNPAVVPMLLNQLGHQNDAPNIDAVTAIRMVRKRRLQGHYTEQGKDILVELIVTKHDEYFAWCKKQEMISTRHGCCSAILVNCDEIWNKFNSFLVELNALVCLILEDDFSTEEPKYLGTKYAGTCLDKDGNTHYVKATILHFAASRNLTDVISKILEKQSSMWECKDDDGNLPLFCAIQKSQDDAASLLVQHMPNDQVRRFLEEGQRASPPLFTQIIKDSVGMQKTAEAILDSFIDPDWSLLLPSNKTKNSLAKSKLNLPPTTANQMFHYHLLDMNEDGSQTTGCHSKKKSCLRRLVEGKCDKNYYNPYHAWKQTSLQQKIGNCLHAMDIYTSNQDPLLRHPVVLMLMRSKWESFGKRWVYKVLAVSLLFLFLLTYALFVKPSTPDRRSYTTTTDQGRLVCEVLSLLIVCGYAGLEMIELVQHKKKYFMNLSNIFDIANCALILLGVLPLRLMGGHMSSEFYVSSAAYMISFVRVSYMACLVSKSMSIYVYALYTIVMREISRFLVLFVIFLFSFGGSVYLALKGVVADTLVKKYGDNSALINEAFMHNSSIVTEGYVYSILQEIRTLAEGNGYAETEDYMRLTPAVLGLIMINMFCGLVILDNILIGQIGNAYADALENARIQYDVGRVKLCTYIEDSWSTDACCTTKRVKFYKRCELLSEKELQKELGDAWSMFKSKVQGR